MVSDNLSRFLKDGLEGVEAMWAYYIVRDAEEELFTQRSRGLVRFDQISPVLLCSYRGVFHTGRAVVKLL